MSTWALALESIRSLMSWWLLKLAIIIAPGHEKISLALAVLDHCNRLEQLDDG